MKLEVIRSDLARGLSPEQIAATRPSLGVSKSTIYRWADEGYGGMSNMELRRKVGYKPRRRRVPRRRTPHSDRRSHAAFPALPRDERDGCWEMDTVEGRAGDSAVVLTLLNRATRFQLALPLASKTSAEAVRALGALRALLGEDRGEGVSLGLGINPIKMNVSMRMGSTIAISAPQISACGVSGCNRRIFMQRSSIMNR